MIYRISSLFYVALVCGLFIGCSVKEPHVYSSQPTYTEQNETRTIRTLPVTFGFEISPKKRDVDTIIIHSSYSETGDAFDLHGIYAEYEQYHVSPHYIIDRDGTIYRMVNENDIAFHAGVSKMPDGREGVNRFSIGIELVNSLDTTPSDAQYTALSALIRDIATRHQIVYILGHKDIAPLRKTDPWNFDFQKLKHLLHDANLASAVERGIQ